MGSEMCIRDRVDALVARQKGRPVDPAPDVEELSPAFAADLVYAPKVDQPSQPGKTPAGAQAVKSSPTFSVASNVSKNPVKKKATASDLWSDERRTVATLTLVGLACIFTSLLVRHGLPLFGISESGTILAFGATLCTALLVFGLFEIADREMSPQVNSLATRWLSPVESGVRVSAAEAFIGLFEATFGRDHLSWKCFWRSGLASMLYLLVALIVLYILNGTDFLMGLFGFQLTGLLGILVFSIIVVGPANIFGDYVSLFQTRWFLRILNYQKYPALLIILVDAVLTGVIYCAFFYVCVATIAYLDIGDFVDPLVLFSETWRVVIDDFVDMGFLIVTAFATTYMTSVWLWVVVIFGPIARLFFWEQDRGPRRLGHLLNVQRHPFRALGALVSILFIIIAVAITVVLETKVSPVT